MRQGKLAYAARQATYRRGLAAKFRRSWKDVVDPQTLPPIEETLDNSDDEDEEGNDEDEDTSDVSDDEELRVDGVGDSGSESD